MSETCKLCGHASEEHGRERDFVDSDSKRELCRLCPGYVLETDEIEVTGYPYGKAWHRFREEGKAL